MKRIIPILTVALAGFALPAAQQQTAGERAAALKATMEASRVVLRQYEWIETTVVSVKGEEKSRKQERCYYGADGGVQKVLLNETPAPEEPRGPLRRRIAEEKEKEMKDYMQEAVRLARQYFPPDHVRIQAAKDAGNVSIRMLDPGKKARLTFSSYYKSGDSFSIDVDLSNNHPLAANVNTTMDSDQQKVTLAIKFATLDNGTVYTSEAVLNIKSKKLIVTVTDSGYRKTNP